MYSFQIEFYPEKDLKAKFELYKLLEKDTTIQYTTYYRKALGFPEVIYMTVATLEIIRILHEWYKDYKNKEKTDIKIITAKGTKISLKCEDVKELELKIKEEQ